MIGTAILLAFAGLLGFHIGQADVRRNAVVRTGTPLYYGVFYGECVKVGTVQACATDSRR